MFWMVIVKYTVLLFWSVLVHSFYCDDEGVLKESLSKFCQGKLLDTFISTCVRIVVVMNNPQEQVEVNC